MKQVFKKILKSNFAYMLVTILIFFYMHFIHITSRRRYIFPKNHDNDSIKNASNVILLSWHDKVMILPHISPVKLHLKYRALVSPHNDGRIISNVMRLLGWKIIEGSTNKNSTGALREIFRNLKSGSNIVITPDGPRGPRHQINSNVIEIAKKMQSTIIPFTSKASKNTKLNSWDKLIFPWPFGKIVIKFGEPIAPKQLEDLDNTKLANILNELDL